MRLEFQRRYRSTIVVAMSAAIIGLMGSVRAQQRPESGSARPLRWPLSPADRAYRAIDGAHLKTYVNELVALTREGRAPGGQYWGRITGQPSDERTRNWVAEKFRQIGLRDVRIEPFDLVEPQWVPTGWEIKATSASGDKNLVSAYPYRESVGTPSGGVDLPAAWVGLGTQGDFAGREVRGKAVFIYSQPFPSAHNHSANIYRAMERARDAGAAAVVIVIAIPGNYQLVLNLPSDANASLLPDELRSSLVSAEPENSEMRIPVFSMGMDDGETLRKLIEKDRSVNVHIRLDVKKEPGLKSGTVWGMLPGASDEEILVMAHRDGYFEGAGDNASGLAAMLGLAEYFAHAPAAQRRRTIRFMAATGHHLLGPTDVVQLHKNRATALSKTALIMNFEHVGWTQTYVYDLSVRKATGVAPLRWAFNGSDQLKAVMFSAFNEFGVNTLEDEGPIAGGDMMPVMYDAPSIGVISSPDFFHSNLDTPEVVPDAALEAATRAYAKIIDQANRLDRGALTGARHKATSTRVE